MPLQKTIIPFNNTRNFSQIFLDYTAGKLPRFYTFQSSLAGIKEFTSKNLYTTLDRQLLVEELKKQNEGIKLSTASQKNIESLRDKNTFTITTGHQLCLATGPLYFIYKILSVINLCEKLNAQNSGVNYVPVYWMACEDHDVEEINHVNLFNKKIVWETEQKGRVGEFSLENIDTFLSEIKNVLGESDNAAKALQLLKDAYSQKDLATATRHLVNELFGKYGIVILDGNSKTLKQQFKEEIRKDIFTNFAFKKVSATIEELKKAGYDTQVNPREVNSFYADKGLRERIAEENAKFKILNIKLEFSKEELEKLIETETEKFSPNVVLRPLYQQKILPNAAYVGGPGELAYWLQYKTMFEEANIPFPVLMPRNFVLYIDKPLQLKIHKLNLTAEDLFTEKDKLLKDLALKQQPFSIEKEKNDLKKLFENLRNAIGKIDKTLEGSTEAELQKALKGIETLEQKAIRSIKQKNEQSNNQVETILTRLFPNGVPQERVENFLRFYISNPNFIEEVKHAISPEENGVFVLAEI